MDCDTLIIGAGSSGCVLSARLSADPRHRVILVEAGPDFGTHAQGHWPRALLDGADWTIDAEWQFWNAPGAAREAFPLACGKVMGGSSSVNAGGIAWPGFADMAEWAGLGNDLWNFDRFLPCLQRVESDPLGSGPLHGRAGPIPVVRSPDASLTPFFSAFTQAAAAAGIGWVDDINDPNAGAGLARRARNTPDGTRWNASFAYLDPVRARANLTILSGAQALTLVCAGIRVDGARVMTPAGEVQIQSARTIVSAGAYNTPALLLRSGFGPADELAALGIGVSADIPGVGKGLRDHPVMTLRVLLTEAAGRAAATLHQARKLVPWQVVLRGAGTHCVPGSFDYQIAPGGEVSVEDGWESVIRIEPMKPVSRGTVTLVSANPLAAPRIDSAFLSDADGRDLALAREALARARDLMALPELRQTIARERVPGAAVAGAALDAWLRGNAYSYHHPAGTCRMGTDDAAVVAQDGKVHRAERLYICDASILPVMPRVPTNLICMAMAERVADLLSA